MYKNYKKSSFSGGGNDCVYVARDGRSILDSKGTVILSAPVSSLLKLVK